MKVLRMYGMSSALLMLAGCAQMRGGTSDPAAAAAKESKAEKNLCQKMSDGYDAIRAFPTVDSETPLDAVQEANRSIEPVVRDVRSAADDVNHPGIRSVQAAYEQLQNSVNSVPGGRSTVGEAAQVIDSDAQNLQITWDRLYGELQCGA